MAVLDRKPCSQLSTYILNYYHCFKAVNNGELFQYTISFGKVEAHQSRAVTLLTIKSYFIASKLPPCSKLMI